MLVFIRALCGTVLPLCVNPNETVLSVKTRIFQLKGITVTQQHLIYDGIELPDSTVLALAKIGHGSQLRLVLGLHSGPLNLPISISNRMSQSAASCHNQSVALPATPVFMCHSRTSREPTVVIPLICTNAALHCHAQHTGLRSSRYSDGGSMSSHEHSSDSNLVSPEEEVSRIAEYLGYAINEGEEKVHSDLRSRATPESPSTISSVGGTESHVSPHYDSLLGWYVPMLSRFQGAAICPRTPFPSSVLSRATNMSSTSRRPTTMLALSKGAPVLLESVPTNGSPSHPNTSSPMVHALSFPAVSDLRIVEQNSSNSKYRSTYHAAHLCSSSGYSNLVLLRRSIGYSLPVILERAETKPQSPSVDQIIGAPADSDNPVAGRSSSEHIIPISLRSSLSGRCLSRDSQLSTDDLTVKRCFFCQRRTGPARGFSCRCERWFCTKHHHPEDHCCDFNFKCTGDDCG